MSTFFKGDKGWRSVVTNLEEAIAQFNSTLAHYGTGVVFKTYDELQG
jgi:hypothetical protein